MKYNQLISSLLQPSGTALSANKPYWEHYANNKEHIK